MEPVSENTTLTIPDWQNRLKEILGSSGSGSRIALVGVGHPLRGDDYVGSYVAKNILRQTNSDMREGAYVFDAEAYIEVFITKLADLDPKHVIFIDACEINATPGEARLLSMAETGYPFFTTHAIPLKVLAEKLLPKSRVWVLAIQPRKTEFGEEMSSEVRDAAVSISEFMALNVAKEERTIAD